MGPSTSTARKPCVLVADDVPANVIIVSSALEDEFDVVQATTGPAVLERVAAGDIDLVLLDVVMPGLDGFDVCRRLKENPATAHVPVIFVTMLEDTVEEAHGFEVGAVDYITKPIRPAIVRARVRTHVELKRTRDMLEQLASVDSLTGVANRRRFDVALDEEWRRCQRGRSWVSLAVVDVDHFKQFNDRYGHLAGDARLRRIAASFARYTQAGGRPRRALRRGGVRAHPAERRRRRRCPSWSAIFFAARPRRAVSPALPGRGNHDGEHRRGVGRAGARGDRP